MRPFARETAMMPARCNPAFIVFAEGIENLDASKCGLPRQKAGLPACWAGHDQPSFCWVLVVSVLGVNKDIKFKLWERKCVVISVAPAFPAPDGCGCPTDIPPVLKYSTCDGERAFCEIFTEIIVQEGVQIEILTDCDSPLAAPPVAANMRGKTINLKDAQELVDKVVTQIKLQKPGEEGERLIRLITREPAPQKPRKLATTWAKIKAAR